MISVSGWYQGSMANICTGSGARRIATLPWRYVEMSLFVLVMIFVVLGYALIGISIYLAGAGSKINRQR